jgi:dihydroneopterin triphosphate diphosphatase
MHRLPLVSDPRSAVVEVHVFRRSGRRVSVLCLRRAPGRRLAGVWQPVTGGRRPRETALAAARREVREETGLVPTRWWALEAPSLYWDALADRPVILPVFAAEAPAGASVRLSAEHDRAEFVSPGTAARRYLWDSQRRALTDVLRQVVDGGPLADALALPPPRAAKVRRLPPGEGAAAHRGRRG